MSTSDVLHIFSNEFHDNVRFSYGEFRRSGEYSDVTLFSEGQEIKAHRVILSSSSSVFKQILSHNKHPNILIYMNQVKYRTLASIIDFIYLGEVSVCEEYLGDFVSLAKELELYGLIGNLAKQFKDEKETVSIDENLIKRTMQFDPKDSEEIAEQINNIGLNETNMFEDSINPKDQLLNNDKSESLTGESFDEPKLEESKAHELLEQWVEREYNSSVPFRPVIVITDEVWGKVDNIVTKRRALNGKYISTCTVCNFVSNTNKLSAVRAHSENHIEGLEYACKICGLKVKISQNLKSHYKNKHNVNASVISKSK